MTMNRPVRFGITIALLAAAVFCGYLKMNWEIKG